MEPAQTAYVIHTIVTAVEERFNKVYTGGIGEDATFRHDSLGWFVYFKGSYEMICLGSDVPVLAPGDLVKITITKEIANDISRETPIE